MNTPAPSNRPPLRDRRAGTLLDLRSLPPTTSLLTEAHRFINWLSTHDLHAWMFLPLHPPGSDGSPYMSASAFALDVGMLSSADWKRLLDEFGMDSSLPAPHHAADSAPLLRAIASNQAVQSALSAFRKEHDAWLVPWATFSVLRRLHGAPWTTWPPAMRCPTAATEYVRTHADPSFHHEIFAQFIAYRALAHIREAAQLAAVELVADMPLYVAHDSADVWAQPHLFALTPDGAPTNVSGVPPDAFSSTGQKWGHPLYRWEADGILSWWSDRVNTALTYADRVRIDHFRGIEAYWAIPAVAENAATGEWLRGPGEELLNVLGASHSPPRLIAEDLGIITPEVDALRRKYRLPGMRVLQFGFDGLPENPHHPANHTEDSVVFTGTHDNPTTVQWWYSADAPTQEQVRALTSSADNDPAGALIELAYASVADMCIVPMQDFLRQGSDSRMNTPATTEGNWKYRMPPNYRERIDSDELRALAVTHARNLR